MSLMAAIPILGGILDKIIPDKNARHAAKERLEGYAQKGELDLLLGQLEINKMEAAHKSLFVAGWRPAIGWICALGLLYNTIIANILGIWLDVPEVDTTLLVPVMMGMLGLGAMRSYEKVNQVAREK